MSSFFVKQGYLDAQRGHTACAYGDARQVTLWNRGYERAEKEGVALYPRFGRKQNKRKNDGHPR